MHTILISTTTLDRIFDDPPGSIRTLQLATKGLKIGDWVDLYDEIKKRHQSRRIVALVGEYGLTLQRGA